MISRTRPTPAISLPRFQNNARLPSELAAGTLSVPVVLGAAVEVQKSYRDRTHELHFVLYAHTQTKAGIIKVYSHRRLEVLGRVTNYHSWDF
jgi:hypothetical protein